MYNIHSIKTFVNNSFAHLRDFTKSPTSYSETHAIDIKKIKEMCDKCYYIMNKRTLYEDFPDIEKIMQAKNERWKFQKKNKY
jgi:hypothetical protein